MINLIGTHHDDLEQDDVPIGEVMDDKFDFEHFDQIFTEGFSQEGAEYLDEFIAADDGFPMEGLPEGGLNRGLEPESLERATDSDIIYLDDELSDEILDDIILSQLRESNQKVTPYRDLKRVLNQGREIKWDYMNFFRGLRDGTNYIPHDYAALSEERFGHLLEDAADRFKDEFEGPDRSEEFMQGVEQCDISFEDYVRVYAESRADFQDRRDEEWYRKINEQLDSGENALVVAGVNHLLDTEGTLRSLLEQDYDTNVVPYRKYSK